MPLTHGALAVVRAAKIPFAPGKAANAGGVSVSGLEMIQNASHDVWTAEIVDEKLQTIMKRIHTLCVEHGTDASGYIDYVNGANIAGFKRVVSAMKKLGW